MEQIIKNKIIEFGDFLLLNCYSDDKKDLINNKLKNL